MQELVLISGKGGTGKTSIAGAFAVLSKNHVLVDCDVDAANLHLLLHPQVEKQEDFWGMPTSAIDPDQCTQCGLCLELCKFGAVLPDFRIDEASCEGCQVCYHACPAEAISLVDNKAGTWFISNTRYGPFVHARLGIAQDNSGKLVTEVRQQARQLAEERGLDLIITDGPPGIGCPVISSIGGVDLALVVVEPSLSSMADLKRVLQLTEHFGVKTAVCINKYDINWENSQALEEQCRDFQIPVLGKISYDPAMISAVMQKKPVLQVNSSVIDEVMELWQAVMKQLEQLKGQAVAG